MLHTLHVFSLVFLDSFSTDLKQPSASSLNTGAHSLYMMIWISARNPPSSAVYFNIAFNIGSTKVWVIAPSASLASCAIVISGLWKSSPYSLCYIKSRPTKVNALTYYYFFFYDNKNKPVTHWRAVIQVKYSDKTIP